MTPPPPQNSPPALLTLTGWTTVPTATRDAEQNQLREDLDAGADLPPTHMHSNSEGTRHTVEIQPPEQGRKRAKYVSSGQYRRMGAPSGHVFEIKATIGRKRVNPIDEGEYHARKSMRCQGESQAQYLVVFGWMGRCTAGGTHTLQNGNQPQH